MLSQLNHSIVAFMDLLLGWLLRFPSDVQLVFIAILSASVLTAVRFWTSDQDLLRRCRADKARLKALLREAKTRREKDAIARHRTTLGMVAMKQLRQEGRPLLASLLPIILLATWALNRLEFHPLKIGEPVEFAADFPISAVGRIAHIVPSDDLTTTSGWIQEITAITDQGPARGIAIWRLAATPGAESRQLRIRFGAETFDHPFSVGGRTYEASAQTHGEHLLSTELKLRPVRLFGVVPGVPVIFFPAWLVAYVLLTIPSVYFCKKLLRIY